MLKDINFGDVDAKNEILKQKRANSRDFFESFHIPERVDIEEILNGSKYFIIGLKGTGKTALLRYISDICKDRSNSEIILFKSHLSEEDKQDLSNSSGYKIIATDGRDVFTQDFKESWKWFIYQKISEILKDSGENSEFSKKLFRLTGASENIIANSIGKLFSSIKSGKVSVSLEAAGIAAELGLEAEQEKQGQSLKLSALNVACSKLLNKINSTKTTYIFFDELEIFHETQEQFNRDRRILRDLIYAISYINSESSDVGRPLYLVSTLRSEVLHSILELGHEIGRDIDDYSIKLDSEGSDSANHPLMALIRKKISVSLKIPQSEVWDNVFPEKINNQKFYKFILNSSYYRPRDIVRLLRVARDFRDTDTSFTTEHFDRSSTEYSKQTWLEVTEELLATYSSDNIKAVQKLFLGFNTHFFKEDLIYRIENKHSLDLDMKELKEKIGIEKLLSDLYRIGVVGNDFLAKDARGKFRARNRWIFRGNTMLNDAERMTFHKSLWKHLSLIETRS